MLWVAIGRSPQGEPVAFAVGKGKVLELAQ